MIHAYLFLFCRFVVGIVFVLSFIAKVTDFPQFTATIRNFRLVPSPLVHASAILFAGCELLVVGLLPVWPRPALFLSTGLLLLFSFALVTVIRRGIRTPCHCFGNRQEPVSRIDLVRNGGLLVFTTVAIWPSGPAQAGTDLAPLHLVIVSFAAIAFVLLWTQLSEIYHLFQPDHPT